MQSAAQPDADVSDLFNESQKLYDAGEFNAALPGFQQAVEAQPENAHYHHMLGKCYGRIAEHGSWFTALRYVKKTLQQLEKTVELDNTNTQAWRDLEEFYRRAPGFLGGNKDKAREIREKLGISIKEPETGVEIASP